LNISTKETIIGFIGTGVMGKSMAGHLLHAGYPLHIFNRTKDKAEELINRGAVWEDTVKAVAQKCDIIITIVGFPNDVEQVYLATHGLIAHVREGTILIDMTTSSPQLAEKIYHKAIVKKCAALDAPVSGGDIGAREARLSIMVGGDRPVFDRMLPILQVMGQHIVYQGQAGSGQHTKMANQIAIASGMIGVCEALAYAKKSGLDPLVVLQSIGGGAAASWSLNNLGPRMIKGNFDPGFYIKHFIKDMTIALESARQMNLETPGLSLAKSLYDTLADQGSADEGTQALFKLFDR
jgi:3-hydroxyisobutyrate dehydrogenase